MDHSPGFLALVDEARKRVCEVGIEDYRARAAAGERHVLVDVREDHEWAERRIPGAVHLGKGVIERDIEAAIPDPATLIVCYCGGGFRSVLVCESLQKMGYSKVASLAGGIRAWVEAGHAVDGSPPAWP
ncbi:MAG TPA: rhodanese-like domain-containing protein [Candidatus Saccharimonadales bacterium]|nr:rhodanese-like domain-containing protein [Candidatus Saccharimonadales bacterium]